MTEPPQAKESDGDGSRNWGYALILLAAVSLFFLSLRLSGRTFIALDFEILIIYVPTLACLLIYAREAIASRRSSKGQLSRENTMKRQADMAVQ